MVALRPPDVTAIDKARDVVFVEFPVLKLVPRPIRVFLYLEDSPADGHARGPWKCLSFDVVRVSNDTYFVPRVQRPRLVPRLWAA